MDAVLSPKVHMPELYLNIYDKNCYETDRVDKIFIHP